MQAVDNPQPIDFTLTKTHTGPVVALTTAGPAPLPLLQQPDATLPAALVPQPDGTWVLTAIIRPTPQPSGSGPATA